MPDPFDMHPNAICLRMAEAADELAAMTGDGRLARAAGILRGKRIGRRAVDDAEALALVDSLLASGLATSRHAACRRAAVIFALPHNVDSMTRRLLRKSRTK